MSLNADLPQVRRGDQWRFSIHDRLREARYEERRRVVEVGARRIVCEIESTDPAVGGGRAEYTREWNLLSRPALRAADDPPEEAGRWRWQPHYPQLRFPLGPGKRWQGVATVANEATGTRNVHRYRARAAAAATATVPAGRFPVLLVHFESDVQSDDGASRLSWRNAETLYYAPRANHVVRSEQRITGPDGAPARDVLLELLAYDQAA